MDPVSRSRQQAEQGELQNLCDPADEDGSDSLESPLFHPPSSNINRVTQTSPTSLGITQKKNQQISQGEAVPLKTINNSNRNISDSKLPTSKSTFGSKPHSKLITPSSLPPHSRLPSSGGSFQPSPATQSSQRHQLSVPSQDTLSSVDHTDDQPTRLQVLNEVGGRMKHIVEPSRIARERPNVTRTHSLKKAVINRGGRELDRPCQQHSFLTDLAHVKEMESSLFQLLDDFQSGNLRAFGRGCSMDQMEAIREQQEKLSRLHFDLGARQDLYAPLSDEGLRMTSDNMQNLMDGLERLSESIEHLHAASSESQESLLSAGEEER